MNKSLNPSAIKSKSEITEALFSLMEKYPYGEMTVKQIILETTLVRKTFYRNFASKDDVLNSYIDNILSEYITEVVKPEADVLDVIFEFCIKYKRVLTLLQKNNIFYLLLQKLNTFIPLEHDKIAGLDNCFSLCFGELTPDYLLSFNIGAIYNVIAKWVERGMTDSTDTIKKTLVAYFRRGILRV